MLPPDDTKINITQGKFSKASPLSDKERAEEYRQGFSASPESSKMGYVSDATNAHVMCMTITWGNKGDKSFTY